MDLLLLELSCDLPLSFDLDLLSRDTLSLDFLSLDLDRLCDFLDLLLLDRSRDLRLLSRSLERLRSRERLRVRLRDLPLRSRRSLLLSSPFIAGGILGGSE